MIVVTTFPDDAWEDYAKRFVETYVQYWRYPLHAFVDKEPPFEHPLVTWHTGFSSHPDIAYFLDGAERSMDYRRDAGRWVFKVIAQCDGIEIDPHMIWLDADSYTFAPPDEEWIERTCREFPIAYLGRYGGHSETGFILYNATYPVMPDFFKKFREAYTKKRIYLLNHWTDCHVFDHLRKGITSLNLSPYGKGVDHVFPKSKPGEWVDHLKGERKRLGESPERIFV